MDPEQALADARAAVADYHEATSISAETDAAERLIESFSALDEWLSKDGFLPADWAAEEDKQLCTVQHGDWTGPHVRISSCPEQ